MKYIIIGGGISGLYCAYMLHKKYNTKDIIIIEKSKILGGRMKTKYLNNGVSIELGAGVICNKHINYLNLLESLNLKNKLKLLENHDRIYYERENVKSTNFYQIIDEMYNKLNDDNYYKLALNYSLHRFIERMYNINVANKMKNEFGYDGDFIYQNAVNGIKMFKYSFAKDAKYYRMEGGLSLIIKSLQEYLSKNSIDILLNTKLVNIEKYNNEYKCILSNNNFIIGGHIILAIPKNNLMEINFLKINMKNWLKTIHTKSLMRIYLFFPTVDNKVWFEPIKGVLTTNTLLRQIIPVNKKNGILMIYIGNEEAKTCFNFKKQKILKREIMIHLRKLFSVTIPEPIKIISKYWNTATHLWKPTYNSNKLYKKMLKPMDNENIYIVGEAYSQTQQWAEGAITSVNNLLNIL